ncbi:hypothetical protein EV663_10480 [Rhodovulum bhavnagarense]|uniref:Uncharacterized protein n=1 Tax=Rhodovulum bhavnagarense TaxID=992286 RepID=A0A4R2RGT9_9RHOB|nr:DciA family protein [Rhodovulum bhavnagarense]TCP61629.1 hypothetical protein EV663_10480 [Rhodovulum bhavnagarense]
MGETGQTPRRARGFERTASLLQTRIRHVGEKRGFAVSRLLTHWAEIVGEETARIARPVEVGYGREGFGATLTLLTTGAQAPVLEMQKEMIREKVNACYGYAAIARIRVTQTAATGFAEGRAQFSPAPKAPLSTPDPALRQEAARMSGTVQDDALRAALEALGENVLSRRKR